MSQIKFIFNAFAVIIIVVLASSVSLAQSTLTDDAQTKSGDTNYGNNPALMVSSAGNVYIKFKVSSTLPQNTPGSDVAKAAIKVFISNVTTPGKIDVYQVTSPWDEATITANNAPALGNLLATTPQIELDRKSKFLVIDITSAVQAWLGDDGQGTNGAPNFGIALIAHPVDANTPNIAGVVFDSKENSQTSHEAQLSIQLTSGEGGLSAVEHDQTLQGQGTAADPLGIATSGVGTTQLANGGVTSAKIGTGQVVKSLNTLKDDVTLAPGSNITVTPSANTLTIAATGLLSGVAHDATLAGDGTAGTPLGVANMGIGTSQLANTAVTTAKLADGAVTEIKIANGAVTSPKLAVPLTLTSANANFTLSVSNTGTGAAITAGGPINTSAQYNIGGFRVLSAAGLNTFTGFGTGQANTTGSQNSFFGQSAGLHNTEGNNNSFFGYLAGQSNTTGGLNSFFGWQAGASNTGGIGNSFFGQSAGQANTNGTQNSFFGIGSGSFNTTGSFNAFFGNVAGTNNTTGDFNSFFGTNAGVSNTSGGSNAAHGVSAGSANTTGSSNSFFGAGAGASNTVEHGNTFIGASSNGAPGITFATAIGTGAIVSQSFSTVLGQNNVSVGIGTSAPKAKLHVNGGSILVSSQGQGIILRSPDGATCRMLSIDNGGAMVLTAIACP